MQSSKLQKYTIYYNNSEEYHRLKKEIFTQDLYHFEFDSPSPIIIDAGAHIGLSVLYFKQLYPNAQITAIEPNPESFKLLEKNMFENQIDDVTLIQTALSNKSGSETLYLDESDDEWHSVAGFHKGSWAGTQKSKEMVVQTHALSEFVTKPIDFLKMDVEGVEQKVLESSYESMPLIKQMIIEFHTHKSQSLKKIVEFLENTHKIELYKGTTEVPSIEKAKGLVMIVATKR